MLVGSGSRRNVSTQSHHRPRRSPAHPSPSLLFFLTASPASLTFTTSSPSLPSFSALSRSELLPATPSETSPLELSTRISGESPRSCLTEISSLRPWDPRSLAGGLARAAQRISETVPGAGRSLGGELPEEDRAEEEQVKGEELRVSTVHAPVGSRSRDPRLTLCFPLFLQVTTKSTPRSSPPKGLIKLSRERPMQRWNEIERRSTASPEAST